MASIEEIAKRLKNKKKNQKKFGVSPGALGGKIKTATKGKVDIGLSEALRKKNKKTTLGKSPGALGGKIKTAPKVDIGLSEALRKKKTTLGKVDIGLSEALRKKNKKTTLGKTDSKSKVKATAGNTKNFASTMAMQKRLIKMGANIKADGLMGAKTRAAMKKFLSKPSVPTKKTTMVDSFKKSNVSANKNKKAGISEAKGDNKKAEKRKSIDSKLNSKGKYKGTNVSPTKSQLEDLKRRRSRASST